MSIRLPVKAQEGLAVLKRAASEWSSDQAMMQGAALAFYTVFSIAPLLIISIAIASFVFGEQATRGQIYGTLKGLLGPEGARGVEAIVRGVAARHRSGLIATVSGFAALLVGASGVFQQLQQSLDLIWKVQPRKDQGFKAMVRQRLLSFSMILVIAFLLLVSLLISAILAAVGRFFADRLPGGVVLWECVNLAVSFAVTTGLFAAIFKVLPDVALRWRDTLVGAAVTALLFDLGKLCIGFYLGRSGIASTYGAAASLIFVLVWVYYSSCILYFGAEFTRAFATRNGRTVAPKRHAERIELHGVKPEDHEGVRPGKAA